MWQGRPAEAEPFLARAAVPGYERRGIAVFVLAGLLMDQRRDLDALTVLRTAAVDDVSDNELALVMPRWSCGRDTRPKACDAWTRSSRAKTSTPPS